MQCVEREAHQRQVKMNKLKCQVCILVIRVSPIIRVSLIILGISNYSLYPQLSRHLQSSRYLQLSGYLQLSQYLQLSGYLQFQLQIFIEFLLHAKHYAK